MLIHMEGFEEGIEVSKVTVGQDHVHTVVVIPPRVSVASVVQLLKSRTGKILKDKFDFLKKVYFQTGIWSRGYCVSTVGLDEKSIMKVCRVPGKRRSRSVKNRARR